MSKTRIYVITDLEDADNPSSRRLVRAISAAQAIRHAADHYTAAVATQDDLVRLVSEDVDVEDATGGVKS